MNEQQLTDRLHAAVLDEPPLGFDPDEIAGRARRGRRRRVLALTSVAATATLLTGLIAGLVGQMSRDREDTATDRTPEPTVITCGEYDFDGNLTQPFPDAPEHIERLNRTVPEALQKHLGFEFEPVLEGMQRYACAPTLQGAYRPVGKDWSISVRLTRESEQLDPTDGWYGEEVPDVEFIQGSSLIRVYTDQVPVGPLVLGGPDETRFVEAVVAGTRHDRDGLTVEVFLKRDGSHITESEMVDLVTDPDLRF